MSKRIGFGIVVSLLGCLANAQTLPTAQQIPPTTIVGLGPISPQSMQGHLSFLASDLLEGRVTPSRGQDIAAEYIAAQFRRVGLKPAGTDGYFQWAPWPLNSTKPFAQVRNVIGLLKGSDPKLSETYIIVSAHYDHLGYDLDRDGDKIFNGANDDGSGTVAVLELASAFAQMRPPPKRSIVFMTFFGEELGLLGSQYYVQHPIFPIDKTVANVNLEQLGRYDAPDGNRPNSFNLTGFDYSDMGLLFATIGAQYNVRVYRDGDNSDSFFARSDNQSFANVGIPAHTLSAALEYGDYHLVSDEWPRIDYLNMANLTRVIGMGVLTMANTEGLVKWSSSNPKASRYRALRPG